MAILVDPFHLQRFVQAQTPVYAEILLELRKGEKTGHWMWFVFPQIKGLGFSAMSQKFSIQSLEEARAYLEHPTLGPRLRECCEVVLRTEGRTAHQIFGSPDDVKFRSSLTLFAEAAENSEIFRRALRKYFGGEMDKKTLDALGVY